MAEITVKKLGWDGFVPHDKTKNAPSPGNRDGAFFSLISILILA